MLRRGSSVCMMHLRFFDELHTVDNLKKSLIHSIVSQVSEGVSLFSFRVLLSFSFVTRLAIIRRNHDVDLIAKMVKVVFVARRILAVALKASDGNGSQGY
jgi:hypothetical protein